MYGLINEHATPIPFFEFQTRILALYTPPLRAKATCVKIRQVLRIAGDLLGPEGTTAGFTTDLVARFIAGRPATETPNTPSSVLASLRATLAIAVAEGWLRLSPFSVRKNWIRRGRPEGQRHHAREDIARVLALAAKEFERKRGWAKWRAQRLMMMTSIAAYTGMRRNEVLHLRVEDVDLQTRIIRIVSRSANRLKTIDSAQPVPIPEAIVELLRAWIAELGRPVCRGLDYDSPNPRLKPWLANNRPVDMGWLIPNAWRTSPWTGGSEGYTPLDRLRSLGKRAGVEGLTFQSLRHSWATMAEGLWSLTPAQIARVLRHTNLTTQLGYRHADAPNLRAMVSSIGFNESGKAEATTPCDPIPAAETPAAEPPAPINGTPAPAALALRPVPVPQLEQPFAPGERPSVEPPGPARATQPDPPDLFGFTIVLALSTAKVVKRSGRPRKRGSHS
jgi:integrase